jgi:hypothetical protein
VSLHWVWKVRPGCGTGIKNLVCGIWDPNFFILSLLTPQHFFADYISSALGLVHCSVNQSFCGPVIDQGAIQSPTISGP